MRTGTRWLLPGDMPAPLLPVLSLSLGRRRSPPASLTPGLGPRGLCCRLIIAIGVALGSIWCNNFKTSREAGLSVAGAAGRGLRGGLAGGLGRWRVFAQHGSDGPAPAAVMATQAQGPALGLADVGTQGHSASCLGRCDPHARPTCRAVA